MKSLKTDSSIFAMNKYYYKPYLMHHGVKGMKWGVRHDPVLVGRKRASNSGQPISKQKKRYNAKKWLKRGAMIATAGLAAYGGYYLYKTGQASKLINSGKGMIKNIFPNKKSISNLDGPFNGKINETIVNSMNPNGDNMNCAFTSTGYIFNKITGKSVTANSYDKNMLPGMTGNSGTLPHFFDSVFDGLQRTKTNPKATRFVDLPTMSKACSGIKDNSHGIMFVQDFSGMGHYVNYEKANGAMRIIDCQSKGVTGKTIDTVTNWEKKGIRPIEIIDCTNAKLADGSDAYLNKILKGV